MKVKTERHGKRSGYPYRDKGHYARKAVWLTGAVLLFVPYVICDLAGRLGEWIYDLSNELHKFGHPCFYRPNPEIPKKSRQVP